MAGAILTCPNCGKRNRVRASPEGVAQCTACGTKLPWLVEADQRSFNAEITASAPLVVDFWAPWCGPYRMVSPSWSIWPSRTPGA